MYNLTDGINVLNIQGVGQKSIPTGFYNTWDLAAQLTVAGLTTSYLSYNGKFSFTGTFTVNSTQLAQMLGVPVGVPITSSSNTVTNMSLGEYVFLEIDELKTPSHVFTGAMTQVRQSNVYWTTVTGANTERAFAPIPLDVVSGTIKNFHENKDYKVSVKYPEPIGSLDRLTVRWLDVSGQPLNFNGLNTNSFLLRLHLKDPSKEDAFILDALPPPVPLEAGYNIQMAGVLLLAGLIMILLVRR
jgi:hypothetical protein